MENDNPYAAPAQLGVSPEPERKREPLSLASRDARHLATFVDLTFIAAFFFLMSFLITRLPFELGGWEFLPVFGSTFGFAFLYYALTEFRTGKSPGKWLFRQTVLSLDGTTPSRWQYVGRTFARLIPIDVLSASDLKPHPIFLRDSLSGTVVVADKRWKGRCDWLEW